MVEKVLQLKCNCNSYPWGRTGRQSLAATLCEKTPGTDFTLDEKSPYAEMYDAPQSLRALSLILSGGWEPTRSFPHTY